MRTRDLKAERRRHGWGQVEAAQRLGVSQPYLAMLENGKRRLTPALARKVVAAYGLPPAELPCTRGTSIRPKRLTGNGWLRTSRNSTTRGLLMFAPG